MNVSLKNVSESWANRIDNKRTKPASFKLKPLDADRIERKPTGQAHREGDSNHIEAPKINPSDQKLDSVESPNQKANSASLEDVPITKRDFDLQFLFPNFKLNYPNEVRNSVPGTFYLVKITQLLHLMCAFLPLYLAGYTLYNIVFFSILSSEPNFLLASYNLGLTILFVSLSILTTRYYWVKTKHNPPLEILSKESEDNLYSYVNHIAKCCFSPKPLQIAINLSSTVEIQSLKNKKNRIFKDTHHDYMLVIGLPLFKSLNSGELAALIAYKISYYSNASVSTLNIVESNRRIKLNLNYPDSMDHYLEKSSGTVRALKPLYMPFIFLERCLTQAFYFIMKNTTQRITHPLNTYALKNAVNLCGYHNTKEAFFKSKCGQLELNKVLTQIKPMKLADVENPVSIALSFDIDNKKLQNNFNRSWNKKLKNLKKTEEFFEFKHMESKLKKLFPSFTLVNHFCRIGQQVTESYLSDQDISPKLCKQFSQKWFNPKQEWKNNDPIICFFNSQFRKNRVIQPKLRQEESGSIISQKLSLKSYIDQIRDDFPNLSAKLLVWDGIDSPYLDKVINGSNQDIMRKLDCHLKESEQLFSERIGLALNIITCFNSSKIESELTPLLDICNAYSRSLYKIDQLFAHSMLLKKSIEEKRQLKNSSRKVNSVITLQQELVALSKHYPTHALTQNLHQEIDTYQQATFDSNEEILERSLNLIWAFENTYIGTLRIMVNQSSQIEKRLGLDPIKLN